MALGGFVIVAGCFVMLIRFSVEHKAKEQRLFEQAILDRNNAA